MFTIYYLLTVTIKNGIKFVLRIGDGCTLKDYYF